MAIDRDRAARMLEARMVRVDGRYRMLVVSMKERRRMNDEQCVERVEDMEEIWRWS